MKILLVNGNTTQAVTEHCMAEARRHAAPGTFIAGLTATYGANIVTAEPENLVASMAVLDMLAEHHAGYDAAILAISFDSGLFAARDLVPIPVIGMTEAALLDAAAHADRIGVLIFGEASAPLYRAQIDRYPMRDKVAAIHVIDVASVSAYLEATALDQAVLSAVATLRRDTEIEALVICGAAMAGMAERLQPATPVRLFGGMAPAIAQAERLGRSPTLEPPPRNVLARSSRVKGLSPMLMALFEQRNAQG
jgi:allantoin racemase